jgi:drug/metabolite transporter (DMT)-like permease
VGKAATQGKLIWYLAAVAGTGMMATLGVFVRSVSAGNEFTMTLGRFGIGFLCLAVLRAFTREDRDEKQGRSSWALVASGIMMPLFVVCYIKAVLTGTMANAAFLIYLGPLIASTLAAVLLGEGFNRVNGVLLGCAVLGTLFITEFKIPDNSEQLESLVFGVLSGLFYGLFLFFNNRKLQGDSTGFAGIFYQFLWATLVMLPVVAAAGAHLTWPDVPWIIAIGIIHGFGALTLVILALRHLKTIEYGTISYGEPVAAALIGVGFYHESVSFLQVVGGLFVIAAGIMRVFIREDS